MTNERALANGNLAFELKSERPPCKQEPDLSEQPPLQQQRTPFVPQAMPQTRPPTEVVAEATAARQRRAAFARLASEASLLTNFNYCEVQSSGGAWRPAMLISNGADLQIRFMVVHVGEVRLTPESPAATLNMWRIRAMWPPFPPRSHGRADHLDTGASGALNADPVNSGPGAIDRTLQHPGAPRAIDPQPRPPMPAERENGREGVLHAYPLAVAHAYPVAVAHHYPGAVVHAYPGAVVHAYPVVVAYAYPVALAPGYGAMTGTRPGPSAVLTRANYICRDYELIESRLTQVPPRPTRYRHLLAEALEPGRREHTFGHLSVELLAALPRGAISANEQLLDCYRNRTFATAQRLVDWGLSCIFGLPTWVSGVNPLQELPAAYDAARSVRAEMDRLVAEGKVMRCNWALILAVRIRWEAHVSTIFYAVADFLVDIHTGKYNHAIHGPRMDVWEWLQRQGDAFFGPHMKRWLEKTLADCRREPTEHTREGRIGGAAPHGGSGRGNGFGGFGSGGGHARPAGRGGSR